MLTLIARLFSDRTAPSLTRGMPMHVPNLIPPDQSRKISDRLTATDVVIAESERARTEANRAAVQFAQAIRETATGILGGDLMADRIGRIPEPKGKSE